MARDTSFNFEELSKCIQTALRDSTNLSYVPDDSIVASSAVEKDIIPAFKSYLIRISPVDSGFLTKTPRIGRQYRNTYMVAIELWIKSGSSLKGRLFGGTTGTPKGVYEFFQDVSDTLEHNTFDDQLDSFPGTNISNSTQLADDKGQCVGIGFVWTGNQDNIK
jgi:hypothetical protein